MNERTSLDDLLNGARVSRVFSLRGEITLYQWLTVAVVITRDHCRFAGYPRNSWLRGSADNATDKNSGWVMRDFSSIGGRGPRASFSRWNPYYVVNQNVARSSRAWLILVGGEIRWKPGNRERRRDLNVKVALRSNFRYFSLFFFFFLSLTKKTLDT